MGVDPSKAQEDSLFTDSSLSDITILSLYKVDTYNMEIIANHKGGMKLVHEGYMYTKKYTRKTTVRWECSNRTAFSCKGGVTSNAEVNILNKNI